MKEIWKSKVIYNVLWKIEQYTLQLLFDYLIEKYEYEITY